MESFLKEITTATGIFFFKTKITNEFNNHTTDKYKAFYLTEL